mmetsp:Transcript_32707/g.77551  ORF Transcript_32707/g.77551 Transcript_32707/m.77551 type:complete len:159 (+) Transcript_32707:55-531(+)
MSTTTPLTAPKHPPPAVPPTPGASDYEESISPMFRYVAIIAPMFWKYHVRISKADNLLNFGYLTGLCSKQIALDDIDVASVKVGSSDWKKNLSECGGWGIRRAFCVQPKWVYNAVNGPWVEVKQLSSGTCYRFVTEHPETVRALLTGHQAPSATPGTV